MSQTTVLDCRACSVVRRPKRPEDKLSATRGGENLEADISLANHDEVHAQKPRGEFMSNTPQCTVLHVSGVADPSIRSGRKPILRLCQTARIWLSPQTYNYGCHRATVT